MTDLIYFDNGRTGTSLFNTLDVVSESAPGAPWSNPTAVTLNGTAAELLDPNVVLLRNGGYLLSYTVAGPGSPPSLLGIDTAISSDGINFTAPETAVVPAPNGPTDADASVVELADGTFLMEVNHPGPTGPEAPASFLTSSDGRTWTPIVSNAQFGGGGDLLLLPDGSVRLYTSGPGGIISYISRDDGQTWSLEPGVRLADTSAALPSVWQTAPGEWEMSFQTVIDPSKPSMPSNQDLTLAASTDGLNFSISQPNFLVQASSADGTSTSFVVTVTPAGNLVMRNANTGAFYIYASFEFRVASKVHL
jgi:hypothetical protein